MRLANFLALTLGGASLLVVACHKVPYTGRTQFNLLPDVLMMGLGKSSYASTLSAVKVKKKGEDNVVLQRVGGRISKVADEPTFDWEYSLINEDEVNAWCLPGGYIGFYSGILPVLESEAGMAFVMGHEVAHATAKHGSERMSQQLTLLGGLAGLELYLSQGTDIDPKVRGTIMGALGVAGQYGVLLPFSRAHEAEADVIGMMYMARAGYPPKEGQPLWDRMAAASGGAEPPVFMSTHPSNERRKANLQEWLPAARKKYLRNKLQADTLSVLWPGGAHQ